MLTAIAIQYPYAFDFLATLFVFDILFIPFILHKINYLYKREKEREERQKKNEN